MKLFVIPSDVYHQAQRYGLNLLRFTEKDYIDNVLSESDKYRFIWFTRCVYRIIDEGKVPLSNVLSMLEKIYPGGSSAIFDGVGLCDEGGEKTFGKTFANFNPSKDYHSRESSSLNKEPHITDVMLLGECTLCLVVKTNEECEPDFVKSNESRVYRSILAHSMSVKGIVEGLNSQLVPLFIRKIS